MPAVSKAQHNFFEMLKHNPEKRKQHGVSMKTAEDFTKNSPKGLPGHKTSDEAKAKVKRLRAKNDNDGDEMGA